MASNLETWRVPVPRDRPHPNGGGSCSSRSQPGDRYVPAWIAYRALRSAGFSPDAAVVMVAIGLAESGLHLDAWHRNTNCSLDDGWLQLNTIHGWPARSAYSLLTAARLAHRLYAGAGFRPWVTYNTSAHRVHMDRARAARRTAASAGPVPPMPGSVNALVVLSRSVTCGGRRILIARGFRDDASSLARATNTCISSGYRTKAQNKAVDGAPNSDHLCGYAADFVGSGAAMAAAAREASRRDYAFVLHEGDHVHVSFRRCGTQGPTGEPGPKTPPAELEIPVTLTAGWHNLTDTFARIIPGRRAQLEAIRSRVRRHVR